MLPSPDPVAQSVVGLIAVPGVLSSIPAQHHSFVENDHEIFSTVMLLLLLRRAVVSYKQKYIH